VNLEEEDVVLKAGDPCLLTGILVKQIHYAGTWGITGLHKEEATLQDQGSEDREQMVGEDMWKVNYSI